MSENSHDAFPEVLRIESIGICNFKCIHCPTGMDPNGRRILKPVQFNDIMEQLRSANYVPRVVVLYHGGEPLLNKYIGTFIKALKDFGVDKTVITTNASLLTEKKSRELILSGLDEMKVSFDGESAEENDRIRVNGNFQKDAENLRNLFRIKRETGHNNPQVIISNILICDEDVLRKQLDTGDEAFDGAPDYLEQFFERDIEEIKFNSYPAMVWPGYKKNKRMKEVNLPSNKPDYCSSLFETTSVLTNGDVVPCCYDLTGEVVFGNTADKSIFDIWASKKYERFRKNFRAKKYPKICEKCNVVNPRYLCKT